MYDPGTLYVDPILTAFSVGFQDQALFGTRLLPVTPVRTKSGTYRVFDRSSWMIHESRRQPGTVANEIAGAKWSSDVFEVFEHSLQAPVHDEERQALTSQGGLADPVFGGPLQIDPETDATALVTRSLLLAHESKVSALIRNNANYPGGNTTTLAGAQQWDNITYGTPGIPTTVTSDPVTNIMTAMRAIRVATGRWPNTLAVPALGLSYIENHPRVVDRFKNFTLTSDGAFRTLTGFDGEVILTDSMYNAANNIDAAASMVQFWGKDVWLGIVEQQPGQKTMTFGKTFSWIYPDGSIRPVDRWREEPRKSDLVRCSWNWDTKIVSSIAGYLIQNAFSAGAF
jgi:hypothetical protein